MPAPPAPPFPFEAVRDLLGILRAVWLAESRRPFPNARRQALTRRLAEELRRTVVTARAHDEGTAPYVKAQATAEAAVLRLGEIVDVTTPAWPVLQVAGERVRQVRRVPSLREQRWASGKKRG